MLRYPEYIRKASYYTHSPSSSAEVVARIHWTGILNGIILLYGFIPQPRYKKREGLAWTQHHGSKIRGGEDSTRSREMKDKILGQKKRGGAIQQCFAFSALYSYAKLWHS